MLRAICAIWCLLALLSVPAMAACPTPPKAEVTVATLIAPLRVDQSLSVAQLSELPTNSVIAEMADHRRTGGITSARMGFNSRVGFAGSPECRHVTTVAVDILLDQAILMASDYAEGSCEYDAIFDHEMLHVDVDRKLVERAVPRMEEAVAKALRRLGRAEETGRDFERVAERRIETAVDRLGRELRRERIRLQNGVDRPSEYKSVRDQCSGWQ